MKSFARHAQVAVRILFGLLFLCRGLGGFLDLWPQLLFLAFGLRGPVHYWAPPVPEAGSALTGALAATGYMVPLVSGVEVVAGALLVVNRYVPLALAALAANVVNIAFHLLLLERTETPLAILVLILEGYLAWTYRDAYRGMLAARAQPTISPGARAA